MSVGWLVSKRSAIATIHNLQDVDYVEERVSGSINESFWEAVADYPMGNGLGGGGTSIPYFLQDRLRNPVALENQYGLIVLEEGIPGLMIWLTFLFWAITSPLPKEKDARYLGLKFARAYTAAAFVSATLGAGILTSIPGTSLLFVYLGWMSTAGMRGAAEERAAERAVVSPSYFATNRH